MGSPSIPLWGPRRGGLIAIGDGDGDGDGHPLPAGNFVSSSCNRIPLERFVVSAASDLCLYHLLCAGWLTLLMRPAARRGSLPMIQSRPSRSTSRPWTHRSTSSVYRRMYEILLQSWHFYFCVICLFTVGTSPVAGIRKTLYIAILFCNSYQRENVLMCCVSGSTNRRFFRCLFQS
jgi:hypothetical protein